MAEHEIRDGTYGFNFAQSGLKKGDTLVLKIMTDAPDMKISTLTGSDASQAYLEDRKREAAAKRLDSMAGRLEAIELSVKELAAKETSVLSTTCEKCGKRKGFISSDSGDKHPFCIRCDSLGKTCRSCGRKGPTSGPPHMQGWCPACLPPTTPNDEAQSQLHQQRAFAVAAGDYARFIAEVACPYICGNPPVPPNGEGTT